MSTTNWLKNNKVAICLYLYHIDLWDEFKELLLPLKDHIKLYIGLSKEKGIVDNIDLFDHHITWHDNYGVDVAPFLQQIPLIKESLFIKIHSKKSLWGFKDHIPWRYLILNDLIGSKKFFHNNIKTLLQSEKNGILCNRHLLMSDKESHNSAKIKEICNLINIDYNVVKKSRFVAGNMFMGKTLLFQSSLNNYIDNLNKLLLNETGQVSDKNFGTYCHSLEQIFGYICTYNNYKFCFPKHNYIKILNNKADNKKYFHMIKTYKNDCYLKEDPNVYGDYETIDDSTCQIIWRHLDSPTTQKYRILNKNTIEKII